MNSVLRVPHTDQEQPLRRRRDGAGAAAAGRQDSARPALGPGPPADFVKRADDGPDHVVEKAVGLDLTSDEVGFVAGAPAYPQVGYRADGRFARRAAGLET